MEQPLLFRPARLSHLDAFLELARVAGTGMTNLQPDRDRIAQMLAESEERLDTGADGQIPTPIWFALMQGDAVMGTAAIFPQIGSSWPFFSYKRTRLTNVSSALDRKVSLEALTLNNDFDGATEVGGLVILPSQRGTGAGRLAARARYMFIAGHRGWFAQRIMAELRGYVDDAGISPVWESLGRPFYGMPFAEADRLSGRAGNQFIAELGPRYPIYVDMLPEAARLALGRPHNESRPAYELLRKEGFRDEGYVDVFDGGPQLFTATDNLTAIKHGRTAILAWAEPSDSDAPMLVSHGTGNAFVCARMIASWRDEETIAISPGACRLVGLEDGAQVHVAPFGFD